ncbi:MAG TPA: heparan-alpha-glucosaminide N-acetyltransferase domain-containing protein [Acidimicrobiales bacterium]|nr:heparan-alpha-glucosaminide N-acetyltransferase domain-containing protein [Acidimicrobiales bacterium]
MSLTAEAPLSPVPVPAVDPAPAAPAKPSTQSGPRLVSLDVVKGLMLIASVGVNAWLNVPPWFDHDLWIGVHPMDWIFPTFVTLSGCGLAFANARRVRPWPAARRVVILLAVGLVYNYITVSGAPFHLSYLRIPGILQLYAVVVIALVLLHTVVKGWRRWALVTAGLAVVDTLFEWGWSLHCAGSHLSPTCNPSHTIDYAVFGANHLYANGSLGYDPEGLVSVVGAIITACLGATVGHALLESRRSGGKRASIRSVGSIAVGAFALAGVLDIFVPAFKKQWTPPFALLIGGAAAVVLLVAHLMVDPGPSGGGLRTPTQRAVTWPLIALGRNSLLVYFGSHALTAWLNVHTYNHVSYLTHFANTIAIGGHPAITFFVVAELFWISLACLLHWRRIYLRP